jgi:hypothetical protein
MVAAEAVDLTINNGLFDIAVVSGTGVADAIVHTGSTGGPAATSATDKPAHLCGGCAQEHGRDGTTARVIGLRCSDQREH